MSIYLRVLDTASICIEFPKHFDRTWVENLKHNGLFEQYPSLRETISIFMPKVPNDLLAQFRGMLKMLKRLLKIIWNNTFCIYLKGNIPIPM